MSFWNSLLRRECIEKDGRLVSCEPGGEVEILGCKLKDGKMDISDHARKKLKRKLRIHANKLIRDKQRRGFSDVEAGRKMIEFYNKIFFGSTKKCDLTWTRWIFPVISETALHELDLYIQDDLHI